MCWYGECSCLRLWNQPFILDQNYLANLEVYKDTNFEENWSSSILKRFWMWIRFTAPLHPGRDQYCLMIKWSSGQEKVLVYSDSVLCLGKVNDSTGAIERWEGQEEEFKMFASCTELTGIDGEPNEFEWNIFPGFASLQILQEIQDHLQKRNIKPEEFSDQILFMLMFNDIDWTRKGNDEICFSNSEKKSRNTRRNSRRDTGRSSVLEMKRSGMEKQSTFLKESGIQQLHRWYSDSGKQVTQSLQVPVLWVVEFWKEVWQRHHTLQCGCFKHRALIPNHSFCKSAQYPRSSFRIESGQFGLTGEEKEQETPLVRKESATNCVLSSVSSLEVKLLVSSPRLASGSSLRRNNQDFESLSETLRFTRVASGMSYKTRPDEDDGFLDRSFHYAENTHFPE